MGSKNDSSIAAYVSGVRHLYEWSESNVSATRLRRSPVQAVLPAPRKPVSKVTGTSHGDDAADERLVSGEFQGRRESSRALSHRKKRKESIAHPCIRFQVLESSSCLPFPSKGKRSFTCNHQFAYVSKLLMAFRELHLALA